MVKLHQLLTDAEKDRIKKHITYNIVIDINKDVKLLTVQELSEIGMILIKTEIDNCNDFYYTNIPSDSLRILIQRAKNLNLAIF